MTRKTNGLLLLTSLTLLLSIVNQTEAERAGRNGSGPGQWTAELHELISFHLTSSIKQNLNMSGDMKVCDIDPELKNLLTAFRFRKDLTKNSAIIMKVDREKHMIILDEELEDTSIEELVETLPDHQPRYVVLSYKMEHSDGRVSYPLCFIFITPRDCNPELQMMYAGSKLSLQKEIDLTRVYELRELEELTEEWLISKLAK